jgi:hypothetical protein
MTEVVSDMLMDALVLNVGVDTKGSMMMMVVSSELYG